MNILALDTATEACSAALYSNGEIKQLYEFAPKQHAHLILEMIDQLMNQSGLSRTQLNAIAFGRGPGSFTGLRVAASTAQGIAVGLDLPVIPISNLHALAQLGYNEFQWTHVISAIDARMDEIYWGHFVFDEQSQLMKPVSEEMLTKLISVSDNKTWNGIGSGWKVPGITASPILNGCVEKLYPERYPRAYEIAQLAVKEYESGNMLSAEEALPTYIRDSVVDN
ncbi:MAG: tRNA (adenosine(37)-N6)-threonylcarbamoyltransferase complex dimerization subunit type 1 TsaB [Proteobacteria bacterium]|nr:tRNA (adenosine(37)-N6)-threonylcarbamoyltransferase complex dimerization subunit type 1 TsaB [Pseudomonadota bacterium]